MPRSFDTGEARSIISQGGTSDRDAPRKSTKNQTENINSKTNGPRKGIHFETSAIPRKHEPLVENKRKISDSGLLFSGFTALSRVERLLDNENTSAGTDRLRQAGASLGVTARPFCFRAFSTVGKVQTLPSPCGVEKRTEYVFKKAAKT